MFRVAKVAARRIDGEGKLPTAITFRLTHVGKSVVRARGRLYAFTTENTSEFGEVRPGVVYETQAKTTRWSKEEDNAKLTLEGDDCLLQPSSNAQINLLSKLLGSNFDQLSQFRPGIFSDFMLSVDFEPKGTELDIIELDLDVEMEAGNTDAKRAMVAVYNNARLSIPICGNQDDLSGRHAGLGKYIGIYDGEVLATKRLRITVPEIFGALVHDGWIVDNHVDRRRGDELVVAKSTTIVATFDKLC